VPIFLSLRVSLPFEFLIVPGGKPLVFSKVPTLQSWDDHITVELKFGVSIDVDA